MKSPHKILAISTFAILITTLSCTKDKGKENGSDDLSLNTLLNGSYNVTSASYTGEIRTFLGSFDIDGVGKNTSGTYEFTSNTNEVDYDFSTTIEQEVFGQSFEFPVSFDNSGDFNITGDNTFTINDPDFGLVEYQVTEKSSSGFSTISSFDIDSAGARTVVDVTIVLRK